MKVLDALSARRAVRSFRRDPVEREVSQELVKAEGLAPSDMNLQPWSFAIQQLSIDLSNEQNDIYWIHPPARDLLSSIEVNFLSRTSIIFKVLRL